MGYDGFRFIVNGEGLFLINGGYVKVFKWVMVREDGSSVLVVWGCCVIIVVVCFFVFCGILVEVWCSCFDVILMLKGKVMGGV